MKKLFLGLVATAAILMAGEGAMKCGAGKCGASAKKEMKKNMKYGTGKCGMASKDKNATKAKVKKAMKCGAGKCGGGK